MVPCQTHMACARDTSKVNTIEAKSKFVLQSINIREQCARVESGTLNYFLISCNNAHFPRSRELRFIKSSKPAPHQTVAFRRAQRCRNSYPIERPKIKKIKKIFKIYQSISRRQPAAEISQYIGLSTYDNLNLPVASYFD